MPLDSDKTPARKIERHLCAIFQDLDEMTPEELNCVRVHLGDLRDQGYPPETSKEDFRGGILCHLEMYIREKLQHVD